MGTEGTNKWKANQSKIMKRTIYKKQKIKKSKKNIYSGERQHSEAKTCHHNEKERKNNEKGNNPTYRRWLPKQINRRK